MTTSADVHPLLGDIDEQLARWRVPGLQLVVVRSGETWYAGGIGRRAVDDTETVGTRTRFHHGSCGKAYTALLTVLLADEGVVDLDEPLRTWIPELTLPDRDIAERVTLRDVLSHRSGLGRHDLAWLLNPSWSAGELIVRLAHLPMTGTFREQMEYSNLGYALCGIALERVTDRPWAELVATRLFEPLGMARATTSLPTALADDDHAAAHLDVAGIVTRTAHRDLGVVAPAGQLLASADDTVRWLALHLDAGPASLASAARTTHQPQVSLPPEVALGDEHPLEAYGMGWVTGTFRGSPMLWHSGGIDGFMTQTLLLPDQDIGVLASANLNGTALPLAVVLAVADALTGAAGTDWFDRLRADAQHSVEDATDSTPAPPAGLAGVYRHDGYGDLVLIGNGELVGARLGEMALDVVASDGAGWSLRYPALDEDLGPLHVDVDANGSIAGVRLKVDAATGLAAFRRVTTS